jgi:hypothetical protein
MNVLPALVMCWMNFDQMLDSFPKFLPSRNTISHHIESELGLQPLTRAPYRL